MTYEYMGKKLEDMTKDELIEAVINLGSQLERTHYEHIRQLKVLSGND